MPSKFPGQARLMAAAAHDPAFAAKVGIPVKVARDFNAHDKGTKLLSEAMKDEAKKKKAEKASASAESNAPPSAAW